MPDYRWLFSSIIKWVFNEVATSRQSINVIWELAREKGLRCCKNTLWPIIRNPVYCGKIYVSKSKDEESQYVEGQHEGIISNKATSVLEKINCMHVDGDLKKKRQVIGPIYPENLIFDGINYRTAGSMRLLI